MGWIIYAGFNDKPDLKTERARGWCPGERSLSTVFAKMTIFSFQKCDWRLQEMGLLTLFGLDLFNDLPNLMKYKKRN